MQSSSTENLLVCTQIMDRKSSTLGFMHRWVTELSKAYSHVTVICLFKGEIDLPANVKVISLGKEHESASTSITATFKKRLNYIVRLYKAVWKERKEYQSIFVHMNQEYVLLCGIFWKILGKRIFMWRNHYDGSILTKLAGLFCEKVFFTSKYSFTAKFQNSMQMPVGVDVGSVPEAAIERKAGSVLFLSRFDPSKKPDIILRALKEVRDKGHKITAAFVGGVSGSSPEFLSQMEKLKTELGVDDIVMFVGPVPSTETFRYYRSHDIYINVSRSGMFDKTIFESLVGGCLPIVTSKDWQEMAGDEFIVEQDSVESLVKKLMGALDLGEATRRLRVAELQSRILNQHSLAALVSKIRQIV